MKQITLLLLLFATSAFGQSYFQQEVNYTIDVQLDDVKHQIRGVEEFEYVNNSPDNLTQLYIHLWPNAYSNGETALAKQQYAQGETDLRFGADSLKGYIDSLDFRINGSPVSWNIDPENADICVINLPAALKSGERLSVTTPFRVQLPSGKISRLGHIGQSYQITQWYPKPAVYDKDGWHAINYLNQGEFYSEYGSFDVRITLPANYVVGATGDLQTESEVDFLTDLAGKTASKIAASAPKKGEPNTFPASSKELKTIRFIQKNVHDFAWFADKRFMVLKGEIELPHSKRTVTSWAMFTPKNAHLWQNAIEYINDGTFYYSKWNGDYPYNNVTAVDGTISAGGGMEYPNVTVIGQSSNAMELEVVIVHEVGHNWFYGQLGSNERTHGWMDEGMNTLNEIRYIQTKYPNNTNFSNMVLNGAFHLNDLDHHDSGDISYRTISWLGEDQPIETPSAEFSPANYGVIMYQKTGLIFFYLKDYLGETLFDQCAMNYYKEWEFKHPSPSDMRASYEKTSGKNLGWLFDDLINTTKHIDYKIVSAKQKEDGLNVTVRNVGQVSGPIEVNLVKDSMVIATQWVDSGSPTATAVFTGNPTFDHVVIDYTKDIPELNRGNNSLKAKGLFKKIEQPKFEFLFGDNESDRSNIFWTPVIGSNVYDKFMVGVAFHNYGITPGKWNFFIAPTFSVGRKMVSGIGEFSVVTQPKKAFKVSKFGLSLKSFKHDTTYRNNESYFATLSPYWQATIGNRDKKAVNYSQTVLVQGMARIDKFGADVFNHAGGFVKYTFNWKKPDHTVKVELRNDFLQNIDNGDQMGRARISAAYGFRYLRRKKERWVEVRGFYGNQYLSTYANQAASPGHFSTYQYGMSLSGTDGQQDLFTEDYYFGRNESAGIWSQQRAENMGGFRSTSTFGTTNSWMATGNLWMQFPYIPSFIGGFVDAGVFDNGTGIGTSTSSAINAGLGIKIRDIFGLYFPIWMSQELNDSYGNANYGEKIRFTLNLNIANKAHVITELF